MSSARQLFGRHSFAILPISILGLLLLSQILSAPLAFAAGSRTSPDTVGDVGLQTSMALDAAGNPVISYFDETNDDLKILHCGDPDCTSGNVITTPDSTGDVGRYSSLVIDTTGNPVVSYYSQNEGLKILHCGNPNCTSGNSITNPHTETGAGALPSMALDSLGNPVVAYIFVSDLSHFELWVLHCGNADCTAGNVLTVAESGGQTSYPSLALDASGRPVISYYERNSDDLKVIHCGDPNCTSGNVTTSPDTAGDVGAYSSLELDSSGNPVVGYYDSTNGDLKLLHCGNPTCTSGNISTSPDTAGDIGRHTSLAIDASGNPIISYYDDTNQDLKVLHCGNSDCTAGNVVSAPDTLGWVGEYTSLVLDSAGNPVVSYYDDYFYDLRVLHCGDANCQTPEAPFPPSAGDLKVGDHVIAHGLSDTVEVTADVKDIIGYSILLNYDPATVTADSCTSSYGPCGIDSGLGRVFISGFPSPALTGEDIVLATIEFRASLSDGISPLVFDGQDFTGFYGESLSASATAGSIHVTDFSPVGGSVELYVSPDPTGNDKWVPLVVIASGMLVVAIGVRSAIQRKRT